jgi:hypothetical protein
MWDHLGSLGINGGSLGIAWDRWRFLGIVGRSIVIWTTESEPYLPVQEFVTMFWQVQECEP